MRGVPADQTPEPCSWDEPKDAAGAGPRKKRSRASPDGSGRKAKLDDLEERIGEWVTPAHEVDGVGRGAGSGVEEGLPGRVDDARVGAWERGAQLDMVSGTSSDRPCSRCEDPLRYVRDPGLG